MDVKVLLLTAVIELLLVIVGRARSRVDQLYDKTSTAKKAYTVKPPASLRRQRIDRMMD